MTVEERLADEAVRDWLGEAAMRVPIVAMNSSAWMVSSGEERYVLKISAPVEEAGLRVASWLNDHGLTTGAPLRMALRIRRRDLRGLIGDADNDKGLADARRVLVDSWETAIATRARRPGRSTLAAMWQQLKDRWAGLQDGQRAALVVALTAVIFLLFVTRRTYLR